MQRTKEARLTEGPVCRSLVNLTLPMLLGMMGMVAFNLADTYFVSQLGTQHLAAISFTFPVVLVVGSLAMGLGVGAAAVISRAIGEGDSYRTQRLTTDSLALALLIVACFVGVGLLTIDPLFTRMGATPEILPLVRQYMTVWYMGVFFVVIPMVGNNAIRATGDTKTPSAIMLVAVAVNITMDPILIFGLGPFPRLELVGAATATVLARASTFLAAVWVLYYRDKMVTLARPRLSAVLHSWRQILYIGLPTAGSNMILPVGIGVITRLLATHSTEAVAAFGVATRIEMVALMVIMALAAVLGPFVGQNWGANRFDRVKRSVQCSQGFSFGWGLFVLTMLAIFARPVAGLFDDNPAVIAKVVLYLRVVPLGYGLQGILMLSTISLNVLNRPLQAAGLTILQMFILYIPLAHLGSYLWAVPGIFAAAATANIIAGTTAFLWLRRVIRRERQAEMGQVAVPESV